MNRTKTHLANIKKALGGADTIYLALCTRIASEAQSYIVDEVNAAQKHFEVLVDITRNVAIANIKLVLGKAWSASTMIGTMDMQAEFKARYNSNRTTLQGLCTQLGVSTSSSLPTSKTRTATSQTTSQQSTGTNSFSILDNLWWIFAIIGGLIGAAQEDGGAWLVGAIGGAVLGLIIKKMAK